MTEQIIERKLEDIKNLAKELRDAIIENEIINKITEKYWKSIYEEITQTSLDELIEPIDVKKVLVIDIKNMERDLSITNAIFAVLGFFGFPLFIIIFAILHHLLSQFISAIEIAGISYTIVLFTFYIILRASFVNEIKSKVRELVREVLKEND